MTAGVFAWPQWRWTCPGCDAPQTTAGTPRGADEQCTFCGSVYPVDLPEINMESPYQVYIDGYRTERAARVQADAEVERLRSELAEARMLTLRDGD